MIAKSIIEAYGLNNIDSSLISATRQASTLGVEAIVDGKDVLVGKYEFLEKNNVECEEFDDAGTIVYVSIDNKCEGYLVIFDELKSETKKAIRELKHEGIRKTVMLTGDRQSIAKMVADEIGIDEYYYEMTPIDKVENSQKLKQELILIKIAFVGDGIMMHQY